MFYLQILIVFFLLFVFNKIYFFYQKKIIFFDYLKKFIYYTFFVIGILYIFLDYYNKDILSNKNYIIINFLIIIYFLTFFSIFLTVSLKSINSPTFDILNVIKNNKISKRRLIMKIRKKKILSKRIKDLINQNIVKNNGKLKLTPEGIIVAKFFYMIKKIFKIPVDG